MYGADDACGVLLINPGPELAAIREETRSNPIQFFS